MDSTKRGDYILVKHIGKGTFGNVYEVKKQSNPKVKLALKEIDLKQCDHKDREHVRREASLLQKCRHKYLVAYEDSFLHEGRYFCLVMELCGLGSLQQYIGQQREGLSEKECLHYLQQICEGLKYLHDQGIIHRDVKTSNIFLTSDNVVKIGDFGLARFLDSPSRTVTFSVGTPFFMSPEMINGEAYDKRTDMWSLACCIYEMSSKETAFNSVTMDKLKRDISSGKNPCVRYCPDVQNLTSRMFQKDPKERPDADEILAFIACHSHTKAEQTLATYAQEMGRSQPITELSKSSPISGREEASCKRSPSDKYDESGSSDSSFHSLHDSSLNQTCPLPGHRSPRRRRNGSLRTLSASEESSGYCTGNSGQRQIVVNLPVLLNERQRKWLQKARKIESDLESELGVEVVKNVIDAVNSSKDEKTFEKQLRDLLQESDLSPTDPDLKSLYQYRKALPCPFE